MRNLLKRLAVLCLVPMLALAQVATPPNPETGAINFGPIQVPQTTPNALGAKGDGIRDDTLRVQACVNTGNCFLPPGYTFKVTSPIQVPNLGQLTGGGTQSVLKGSAVTGGVVQSGGTPFTAYAYNITGWRIHNFAISGTATDAVLLTGAIAGELSNITLLGPATFTDGFVFDGVFSSDLNSLSTSGVTIGAFVAFTASVGGASSGTLTVAIPNASYQFIFSNREQRLVTVSGGTAVTWSPALAAGTVTTAAYGSDFKALGAFNANRAHMWQTSNYSAYNAYLQADSSAGTSRGNTFDALTLQGGQIGLYVGNLHSGDTFNSPYFENCVNPIVLGRTADNSFTNALTFNSPEIGPVAPGHPQYANRLALIDVNYAHGVSFNSPLFTGSFGIETLAPLSFSGGGGTGASGVAIVNAAGVIKAAVLTSPGKGYTSAPAITVGGAGSSGAVTALQSFVSVFTGSISAGGVLTVTNTSGQATARGGIQLGATLSGTNVTAGAYISGFLTGTGDVGDYVVTGQSGAAASTTITASSLLWGFSGVTPAITVTNGGTGYGGNPVPPLIYNTCSRITITAPFLSFYQPTWPYIVRYSNATSVGCITIKNDISFDYYGTAVSGADFGPVSGGLYQHSVEWREQGSGAYVSPAIVVRRVYQIQAYP